ncbi:hypothetical protein [Thermostaphylospora chromogena]|uniref:hypothetical protein n=1 Tax=Thermostaphylospora chromogena TaxID=35622 RepID=UPI001041FF86|nr:hypothetical protein [Thermostaphylospora chromogena]
MGNVATTIIPTAQHPILTIRVPGVPQPQVRPSAFPAASISVSISAVAGFPVRDDQILIVPISCIEAMRISVERIAVRPAPVAAVAVRCAASPLFP